MHRILESLQANHGVGTRGSLLELGVSRHAIRTALAAGAIVQPKRGWYALPGERHSDAAIAAMLGGTLTCVTALVEHGIWVPRPVFGRHLRVSDQAVRRWPRDPLHPRFHAGTRLHRQSKRWRPCEVGPDRVDPPLTAVLAAEQCLGVDELVAVLESMRRKGIGLDALRALGEESGARLRTAVDRLVERTDSGLESLVRMRLRAARIRALPLVRLGPWTVDLLIGDWLVVEVDGFAYHSGREEFERDRTKDRELVARGYTVLRLSSTDVEHAWPDALEQIQAAMRAGWHRRPRTGAQPDFDERRRDRA